MATPKLTYFNVKGRAEVARYLFALKGEKYEDIRVQREEWQKMKEDTPFGQLPLLEEEGLVLCQSRAIGRYLANKFNLAGSNARENAIADMIVDCCEDSGNAIFKISMAAKDDEAKKENLKKFSDEDLPCYLGRFNKMLENNGGGKGFFVGDSITWADLTFYNMVEFFGTMGGLDLKGKLQGYPKLEALVARVEANEGVSNWQKKRPVTNM